MIEPLRPDWPAPPGVRAAMTTRAGGVSQGPYASLNLGLGGDDPACVAENRRRLRQALALPAEPRWLKQVHGATVVRLFPSPPRDGPEGPGEGGSAVPEADASYTTDPGVVCVVQAADCLPVLFCDDAGSVVAAAHAGWRGLAAGVLEATVRALPVPPASLMAWLGAAIGPASFEVGAEVRDAFVRHDPAAAACFRTAAAADAGAPKFLADLYALARRRLAAAGVTRVSGGGLDTVADPARFHSYRRDGRSGRLAALVWLSP
jgi:polyphenol oxidase